jgi:5-methylthioribose kinase
VFTLNPRDSPAIGRHLCELGFIDDDRVLSAEKIGGGDMSLTVRVQLPSRSVILKQALQWAEKYPKISVPVERSLVEAAFYEAVTLEPAVSGRMPALLGADPESFLIILEDVHDAVDCMGLYASARLTAADFDELVEYLSALHSIELDERFRDMFANREMRALNHALQYDLPLRAADVDGEYRAAVEQLGRAYLEDGPVLVHGDYFPGSWLRNDLGLYVINPEFCFMGRAEYDLGILQAHLIFTRHEEFVPELRERYNGPADWKLAGRYAGAELMRRLIGVTKLPLQAGEDHKTEWLRLSRELVCP